MSQLPRLAMGRAAVTYGYSHRMFCWCEQNISAAPPGAAQRARGIAQAVTFFNLKSDPYNACAGTPDYLGISAFY